MAVYIIKHPDASDTVYKIGKANQPTGRFGQLATGYVADIKNPWFIYPTSGDDFNSGKLLFIEKQIHKLYAAERVRPDREFFRFNDVANAMSKAVAHINALGIPCRLTHDLADIRTIDTRSYLPEEYKTIKKIIAGRTIEQPVMRDYQIGIAELLSDWHYSVNQAGKIILPPGIGKTYIAAQYIARFKPARVLIITPQIMICDGFAEVLGKYGIKSRVLHSEAPSTDVNARCIITTYQTAVSFSKLNDTFDLIVYDEAHHTCAPEYAKTRDISARRRLYMTATEKIFDDQQDMSHESYGPTIARMDIKDAVLSGLLCDYQIYMCDWKAGLLEFTTQLTDRYLRKRLVFYFNTVDYAQQTAAELVKLGVDAAAIHSGQTAAEKAHCMSRFKSGTGVMVLCNVNMVGEGVDLPSVDTIVFMEPRMSNIGVIQNIGRGLRLSLEKDFCMVLVNPAMIKTVLLNLETYDSRVRSPALYNSAGYASDDLKYSVSGIVDMFKLYDSRDFNALQKFISTLRDLQIYCESDYTSAVHNDEMPKVPQLVYPTFTWSMVLPRNLVVYDGDTAKKRIADYMADPVLQAKINACRYLDQKYVVILQLDAAIPYNAVVEALKIRQRR
jgi:superfamily II DNA or RNA helicase